MISSQRTGMKARVGSTTEKFSMKIEQTKTRENSTLVEFDDSICRKSNVKVDKPLLLKIKQIRSSKNGELNGRESVKERLKTASIFLQNFDFVDQLGLQGHSLHL